jgi:replicative superfamily II helicase
LFSNPYQALIVFPFVALAREKYNSFRMLYQYSDVSIACFAGGSRPVGGIDKNNILIATIEKG